MADIFDEVDEDVKRDEYHELWKKYGNWIIGAAVAAVIGTALGVAYRDWKTAEAQRQTMLIMESMDKQDNADSAKALEKYATDAPASDAMIAKFLAAAKLSQAGDSAGAVAAYEKIAAEKPEKPFDQLAALLAVMNSVDTGEPAALITKIEPLTADGAPFRASALELKAMLIAKTGDTAKAHEILVGLADDNTSPADLRGRAAEMARLYAPPGEKDKKVPADQPVTDAPEEIVE